MPQRKLHIIAFDVPYPPDYGGAMDVFYKIKSLSEAGCGIYLHCYDYGRGHSAELEKYCSQVWYYPRHTGWRGVSFALPYIVYSRRNGSLLQRLIEINAPILFEGIHTTFHITHPALKDRYKAIRTHNIESDYYSQLYHKEHDLKTKLYYRIEALLAKKYERKLHAANSFFELSLADRDYFKELYPVAQHTFLAPFHPYHEINMLTGIGSYCLYHGNLSHPENREAVLFLLKEVFSGTDIQVVIAGKAPSKDVVSACNELLNCKLVPDPGEAAMRELIRNTQIHVLPTFQQSGMKLKLLNALFGGRHVLANDKMLFGTGLEAACHIANNADGFLRKIKELMPLPFTQDDIESRKERLKQCSNDYNAKLLLDGIFK